MTILQGDWIEQLRTLPDESVQCCVTSPPYWGLRDYGNDAQLGLEKTPKEYVAKMVEGFAQVRRVLKNDGTLWLVISDSYAEKNLVGIPWLLAHALRSDGWYLRSEIIWAKPNPMPESVTDRPTRSHEYIFLLTKSQRYYYDSDAIKEKAADWHDSVPGRNGGPGQDRRSETDREFNGTTRNKRSVWTVSPMPYREAHFATFPPDLIKPCILAGSRPCDTVLDPFAGSGTTGMVAIELGRNPLLIELNPAYIKLIEQRTNVTLGLAL